MPDAQSVLAGGELDAGGLVLRDPLGQRRVRIQQHVEAFAEADHLDLGCVGSERLLHILDVGEDALPLFLTLGADLEDDAVLTGHRLVAGPRRVLPGSRDDGEARGNLAPHQ